MQSYVVVDLEATCWPRGVMTRRDMETIEIGAVTVNSEWQSVTEFSEFVKPILHPILSEFCKDLTGIQQSDVDNAEVFPVVFERFLSWVEGAVFYSWGAFDADQFMQDCVLHKIAYPFNNHIDLSRLYTKKTCKRLGHRQAMKRLGIVPEGDHHRGLPDARNIVKMLPFLLED
jgi:inhibitor of KinA sporulation pathway (predicted exonuclease)